MESAIYIDCRLLIDKFVEKCDYRFKTFINQWKTMDFYNIWADQQKNIDLVQTTQAILQVARRIACGKWIGEKTLEAVTEQANLRRIGGIYLMYVVYHNQPALQTRIQISLETWQTIKNYIEAMPAKSKEYDDVRYVFWKLIEDQAFVFCALDYPVGLENLLDYDTVDDDLFSTDALKLREQLPNLELVMKTTSPLTKYEDNYNQRKARLQQKDTLLLSASNVFKGLAEGFNEINEIIQDSEKNEIVEEEPVVNKKRELKHMGYKVNTQNPSVGDSTNQNSEMSLRQRRRARAFSRTLRRMSARTIFAEKLPTIAHQELEADASKISSQSENEDNEKEITSVSKVDEETTITESKVKKDGVRKTVARSSTSVSKTKKRKAHVEKETKNPKKQRRQRKK